MNEVAFRGLNWVAQANKTLICAGYPEDYDQALAISLASAEITNGHFIKHYKSDGGILTIKDVDRIPIYRTGKATHVALINTNSKSLCYVTTCTPWTIMTGGTVDVPSWNIKIGNPEFSGTPITRTIPN